MKTHFDAAAHKFPSDACTACGRTARYATNRGITGIRDTLGQQAGVTKEFALFVAAHQMPGVRVFAIGVEVRAVLLHDENFLAQCQDVIKFGGAEVLEWKAGEDHWNVVNVINVVNVVNWVNVVNGGKNTCFGESRYFCQPFLQACVWQATILKPSPFRRRLLSEKHNSTFP